MSSNPGDLTPGDADPAVSTQGVDLASDAARSSELSTEVQRLEERDEHCGPLLVRRYLKDDGRTLLLYRHIGGQRG